MASEDGSTGISLETARSYAANTEGLRRADPQAWAGFEIMRDSVAMKACREVVQHQPLRGKPDLAKLSAWKLNLEAKVLRKGVLSVTALRSFDEWSKREMPGYDDQDREVLHKAALEAANREVIRMGEKFLDDMYAEQIAKFEKASEAKKDGQSTVDALASLTTNDTADRVAEDGKASITETEKAGAVDGDTHKNGGKNEQAKVAGPKESVQANAPAKSARPAKKSGLNSAMVKAWLADED